jgi:NADH-quinone oxidoreductase subunit L
MPVFLENQPGLLFVAATLLPALSFLVILLAFAVKTYCRKNPQDSGGAAIFRMLGGPVPSRVPAYIATAAIGLAFLCSFTGFQLYLAEHDAIEAQETELEDQILVLRDKRHHLEEDLEKENTKPEPLLPNGKKAKAADKKAPDGAAVVDQAAKKSAIAALAKRLADVESDLDTKEEALQKLQMRWSGRVEWARVRPSSPQIEKLKQEIAELHEQLPKREPRGGPVDQKAQEISNRLEDKQDELADVRKYQPGTVLWLGFRIDMLSALMFVMVTFIATLIHIFSIGYMAEELSEHVADHHVHTAEGHLHRRGRFGRFFLFLSLFCFSMLNLVLADNLFQVFVSWELVGVCSYLLIGFYFERQSASNAANKAFITNRVGDAGFIIGLLIIWTFVGTFNFEEIFARVRSPLSHAHNGRVTGLAMAGQIVRVRSDATDAEPHRFTVLDYTAPLSGDTQALLFPIEPGEHTPDLKPGNSISIGDPNADHDDVKYSTIPFWMLVAAGLGIFLGCVGKSAQFPLQVWLPDAMEGPTPVSALIHAATMVAAGVYLVGRCYPLFTGEVLLVIAYTGGITCFVAASIALVATDIKKVLAYSTVSQLGYMMLALGVGGWVAGLFHLYTHAFFKALLFLGSGSVIYGCHHEQEMPKMGGLFPKMPITAITMLMGVLAIAGVPMFSGWYSKDAILVQAFAFVQVNRQHFLLFLLPLVTAGLTAFYMFRMWFMTFTGKPRDAHVYEHAHEPPYLMTIPLIILAFFSVTIAWGWPVYDAEASWIEHQHHHAMPHSVMADFGWTELDSWRGGPPVREQSDNVSYQVHVYHPIIGLVVLGVAFAAFCLAACVYFLNLLDPVAAIEQFPGIYRFLAHKWYFDEAYSVLLVRPALAVAGWCKFFDTKIIDGALDNLARGVVGVARGSGRFDKGVIDGLVNVVADACYSTGTWLKNVQTGYLRSYVVFLVLAAVGAWIVLSSLLGAAPAVK